MLLRRTAVWTAVTFAALAGCSGGGGSILSGGGATQLSPRTVSTFSPSPTPLPTPTPAPPNGTLYVAGSATVFALPLSSNGTTTATRSIKPHPSQSRTNAGIATNADGTLDVLQNYVDNTTTTGRCQIVVEPANANGSPAASNTDCDSTATTGTTGTALARNAAGGFDVVYSTQSQFLVKRFSSDGATVASTLTLGPPAFAGQFLGTDSGGHDYLADVNGEIRKYKATATSVTDSVADCTITAPNADGPLAVAPDKTIYIVDNTTAMVPPANPLANQQIDAITGCGTGAAAATVSRTIGPFPNQYVSALAVDSQGELYVAMNSNAESNQPPSVIRVYASNANSATAKPLPLRIITPSPAMTKIYGLAIFE